MSQSVLMERRGSVAVLTLNRPEKRNVLSDDLVQELGNSLEALQTEKEIRAIVLNGGDSFCSGGDLEGMSDSIPEMQRKMRAADRVARILINGPLPAVAAVQGYAYGAGFSIALACDFVVADAEARFCSSFGKVGLVPDLALIRTLPQRVGLGLARELLMLSQSINGRECSRIGLVDRLSPPGEVMKTAMELAERLANASPCAIAATKAMLSRMPLDVETLLAWEVDTQALLLGSEDFREGRRAFAEKRPAQFPGH